MKSKSKKILLIATSAYAILYLAGMITSFIKGELFFGFVTYADFLRSGPWIIAGIVILLQGIIYIKHHFQYSR